jgi:hypothetical protein
MKAEYAWYPGNDPLAEAWQSSTLILEPDLEPLTPHAAHFLGSVQIAGWLARHYLLVMLLRPVILRHRQKVPLHPS